ncbi:hypothetical protein DVA67_022815 [Solirubrobacter sp. CPCC 204708]|uniref:DUF1963 domain-containing protein n=1 Tax=Solirubrobacter deserti TaxID=2282478 RepID=A0ABT4RI46_9ACTN|nr:hypothetical protein [Solirubrobacter deserti]MBE2318826.1 hypothetical protein [Solirubrobacter deserti]MDA0138206.1 hypothetical protein [Solirubrobacter deserti]
MTGVLLTAEELHFLAGAYELDVVPGLEPLPVDPDDAPAMRLLIGTAARSLVARELGAYGADDKFVPASWLDPLLETLPDATWSISAEFASAEELGAAAWWGGDGFAVELIRTSFSDYALSLVEDDVRERVGAFLGLTGDDTSVGAPEPFDAEALREDPSLIARASRLTVVGEGAEGVELEWLDRGDGPVLVIEDDALTPTGRAAVLDELFG